MLFSLFLGIGTFVETILLRSYEDRTLHQAKNSRQKILSELGPALVRECLLSTDPDREQSLHSSLRDAFYYEDVVVFRPDGSIMVSTAEEAVGPLLDSPERNRWLPVVVQDLQGNELATLVVLDRDPWQLERARGQFLQHLGQFVTGRLDNSFLRFIFFAALIAALASVAASVFLVRWVKAHRRFRRAAAKGQRLRNQRRELEGRLEEARESLSTVTSIEERELLEKKIRGLRFEIEVATDRAARNDAYRVALDGHDLNRRIEAECRISGHCTFNAMVLGREFESEVRARLREAEVEQTGSTMFDRLRALHQQVGIDRKDFDRLQRAWRVRNRVIHDQHECTRDEGFLLARALRILRSLSSQEIAVPTRKG